MGGEDMAGTAQPHGTADEDGYAGPAVLVVSGRQFDVSVELRGVFQPIDGRYHWWGRVERDEELAAALGQGRGAGEIVTLAGRAACELSDPDPWQRYRITGTSTPPFPAGPFAVGPSATGAGGSEAGRV
jgi:hypothetical protein